MNTKFDEIFVVVAQFILQDIDVPHVVCVGGVVNVGFGSVHQCCKRCCAVVVAAFCSLVIAVIVTVDPCLSGPRDLTGLPLLCRVASLYLRDQCLPS